MTMCTGLEIALLASTAITATSSIQQGREAKKMGEYQQAQAQADSQAEREAASVRADKIRKAGQAQRSAARSSLARSGVVADAGTALTIQDSIVSGSEEDALSEILSGGYRSRRLEQEGDLANRAGENAMTAGILGAGKSLLAGAYEYGRGKPGWKQQQPPAPVEDRYVPRI
jgi:hypothetical protein